MDTVKRPFRSILVPPTRVFKTTRSTAMVTTTCIRLTQEVTFLGSPFDGEQEYSVNDAFNLVDTVTMPFLVKMPFPGIFVSRTRVFKSPAVPPWWLVTPTMIRSRLQVKFLGSVFKWELDNNYNSIFIQLEGAWMPECHFLAFSSYRRAFYITKWRKRYRYRNDTVFCWWSWLFLLFCCISFFSFLETKQINNSDSFEWIDFDTFKWQRQAKILRITITRMTETFSTVM